MAHRQKEVVITQQLTSFNYSKRAQSSLLYASQTVNGCKTLQLIVYLFISFLQSGIVCRDRCVCMFDWIEMLSVLALFVNKLSNGNTTTILFNRNFFLFFFFATLPFLPLFVLEIVHQNDCVFFSSGFKSTVKKCWHCHDCICDEKLL